jgi:hypothetical protein
MAFQFRICHSWIGVILVRQVANIMPPPSMDDFRKICQKHFSSWNFPNCVGAINAKHVRIKSPKNRGSLYFNYKEFYSIVMLAIVDADLKFAATDVGSYGREGDAGIYLKSNFGTKIIYNEFNIPPPQALPQTNTYCSSTSHLCHPWRRSICFT